MKSLAYALLASAATITPALALQLPVHGSKDPTQCTIDYDTEQTTNIQVMTGDQITLIFGDAAEHIISKAISNDASLKSTMLAASNQIFLKTEGEAWKTGGTFQVAIRTRIDEDDKPHDYQILFTAVEPEWSKPKKPIAVATTDTKDLMDKPEPKFVPCYVVRFIHSKSVSAAKLAAGRAWWQKQQEEKAEIKLREQQMQASINTNYDYQGDRDIGPRSASNCSTRKDCAEIYDDGFSTFLRFPGNLPIPTFFSIKSDGTDDASLQNTAEDSGTIKLHGVYRAIRLRSVDHKTLCLFNLAYDNVGHNPETGTTSPDIGRGIAKKK